MRVAVPHIYEADAIRTDVISTQKVVKNRSAASNEATVNIVQGALMNVPAVSSLALPKVNSLKRTA